MTESDLAEIAARCEGATAGPWTSFIEGRDHTSGENFIQTACDDIYFVGCSEADQDFIANARQDIPLLIAEVRRLWRVGT